MSKTSLGRFRNPKLIKSYWEENGERCEVWSVLPDEEKAVVRRLRKTNSEWLELHHILRQPGYKAEFYSSVIIISSIVHGMAHDNYQSEVTTACLFAKYRKAENDVHELNSAGPKKIYGTIQGLRSKLSHRPEYVDMCDQMLATLPDV